MCGQGKMCCDIDVKNRRETEDEEESVCVCGEEQGVASRYVVDVAVTWTQGSLASAWTWFIFPLPLPRGGTRS